MLESIFSTTTIASISTANCAVAIIVAIVLGVVVSVTHKLTTRSTQNFLITLGLLPVLVEVVILLVNGNLGTSLAVAGAFGLIRFRSMQGTSKEIISIFWAMTIGLALGMGYIVYAVIITIVVAILMFLYNTVFNKTTDVKQRKLKIVIPENLDYEEVFNDIFKKYTKKCEIRKARTTNMGSTYELSYFVCLKNEIKEKDFLDEIRVRNGNMLVMLERNEIGEEEL